MKLDFKDPEFSPPGRRNPLHGEVAAALQERPGMWAVWPVALSGRRLHNKASQINSGRVAGMPPGEFEARVSEGVLYVRYIGGAS